VPPIGPPTQGDQTKKLWIKCRGHSACEGNESVLVFEWKLDAGGTRRRYKCCTCGRAFYINN
jgi:hypothetical protein